MDSLPYQATQTQPGRERANAPGAAQVTQAGGQMPRESVLLPRNNAPGAQATRSEGTYPFFIFQNDILDQQQ